MSGSHSGSDHSRSDSLPAVRLLGVIDLRQGRAVHAVAGRRTDYRPLDIPACRDADPIALAEHYRALGVAGLYIADLDRIVDHRDDSLAAVDSLRALGLPIWIDRGPKRAAEWGAGAPGSGSEATANPPETTWIVGTESLGSLDELREMVERQSAGNALAVSLDLRGGQLVAASNDFAGCTAWKAAEMVAEAGVQRLIVLDVARVGTASGPTTAPLCRRIREALPQLTIASGGGVRDAADAAALHEAGCDWVLAGTWLHKSAATLLASGSGTSGRKTGREKRGG